MPIRFRCAYCNQLMGIARRKAGTVVRCPSCSGQVVVPNPEEEAATSPAQEAADPPPLFERSDFDEFFAPTGKKRSPSRPPTEADQALSALAGLDDPRKRRRREPEIDVVPLEAAKTAPPHLERPGLWLSPRMVTLLSVGIILALALSFAAGFWVGHITGPDNSGDQTRNSSLDDLFC
jgi:phage FluMu protein Com